MFSVKHSNKVVFIKSHCTSKQVFSHSNPSIIIESAYRALSPSNKLILACAKEGINLTDKDLQLMRKKASIVDPIKVPLAVAKCSRALPAHVIGLLAHLETAVSTRNSRILDLKVNKLLAGLEATVSSRNIALSGLLREVSPALNIEAHIIESRNLQVGVAFSRWHRSFEAESILLNSAADKLEPVIEEESSYDEDEKSTIYDLDLPHNAIMSINSHLLNRCPDIFHGESFDNDLTSPHQKLGVIVTKTNEMVKPEDVVGLLRVSPLDLQRLYNGAGEYYEPLAQPNMGSVGVNNGLASHFPAAPAILSAEADYFNLNDIYPNHGGGQYYEPLAQPNMGSVGVNNGLANHFSSDPLTLAQMGVEYLNLAPSNLVDTVPSNLRAGPSNRAGFSASGDRASNYSHLTLDNPAHKRGHKRQASSLSEGLARSGVAPQTPGFPSGSVNDALAQSPLAL